MAEANRTVMNVLSISQLRAAIKGQVITPDDADYEEARMVFYGNIDRHPAVIVRVANADDVAYVVNLARDTGIELAVRSGGHSIAGHSVSEGGIVLDLSGMKRLDIDAKGRTAWAETGLTAGEYSAAAARYGLATGFGDSGLVGIGGITLGGGMGFLVRKHGMTIDDLLAAEIVTADGQLLHVDSESHPDLFWALRGGGGNFGVVTRFKYRLHEVGTILGGMLMLPATADTIHKFFALADAAPEELTVISNVMTAPPIPSLPVEAHGKTIIMAFILYAGDIAAGEKVIAPFRALATPIADMVRTMPYPEIFPPDEEGFHPLLVDRSMFIDTVDQSTAELILDRLHASTAQVAAAHIRVLGGAMARVPIDATAFAHRTRRILVNVAALYENPDEAVLHEQWVIEFAAALSQGAPDVYVNFLGNEGEARIRDAYPVKTWDRLAAIKAQYDPTNLFRLNHNIPPAAAT